MREGSRTLRVIATVGCVAVLVSACSGGAEDETTDVPPAAAGPASPASAPGADDASPPSTEPTPAVGQSDAVAPQSPPAEPLASISVPIAFIEDGEVEMAVTSIELAGELMRVGITFTASLPPEAPSVAVGAVLAGNENAPGAGIYPELIDPVNLKAYQAVAGFIGNGTQVDLQDAVPRTFVFYFAAPQDAVEAFDVVLSSQVPTITDVPFEQ